MKPQIDNLLEEFSKQIEVTLQNLSRSTDEDEKDQLSYILEEYIKVTVKLERIVLHRKTEHEKANRN